MKKKLLSLLLLFCFAFASFAACGGSGGNDSSVDDSTSSSESSDSEFQPIDYASAVTLDMNSTATIKQEATVKIFIDGDTTHFNVPNEVSINNNGVLKARYLAVNTPESTGKVEEWGKAASNFTKSKLQQATSIILETDSNQWEIDSTGDRHLVWVWYKTAESNTYRNLNIEILQNGLAIASDSQGNRYGSVCGQAIAQAQAMKLHVYSDEKDPDFYYGDAIPVDLKELRLNVEDYVNKKVAFEGVFTYNDGEAIYVEDYDDETSIWYGMYIYYGFNMQGAALEILSPGNHVRVVGTVQYYEAGDSYQVSGIEYNRRNPDDPNSMKLLDTEYHAPANLETTLTKFNSSVEIQLQDETQATTYKYVELALNSSISMKSLKVVSTYTTNNGGKNDGAISITCQDANGNKITVRTAVLRDENGAIIKDTIFKNKTIDVKGVIDYYKDTRGNVSYQIAVFDINHITIH